LTTTARTLSWGFMCPALALAALADLRWKFLSWRCASQVHRQVSAEPLLDCWSSVRRWYAFWSSG